MSVKMSEQDVLRDNAKNALQEMKKYEILCAYTLKLPNGTIISCKSEERLEEYKKLFNVK